MLALAIEKKKLISGQPIIEAASGPFAVALTLAGLTAGHPVVLVMPEDAPPCGRRPCCGWVRRSATARPAAV